MEKLKARAIFTNDAECDDMNSFVHLLLYANDIDIEGLVLSSSIFHYEGDAEAGVPPYRWAGGQWMWDYLDAYEQVWPNLVVHDPDYPTPAYLRSVTCIGNVKSVGDMDGDTEGSELIRRRIFAEDPRQLYLLAGGGTNTIGRTLKRVEEDWRDTPEWEGVYRRVCEKTVIFMIVTQDDTYRDYICRAWPDIRVLHCTSLAGIGFFFDETCCSPEHIRMARGNWMKPHLLDKGPLLAHYHTWLDGHVYPGEEEQNQFGSNPTLAEGNWWGKAIHEPYDMISEGDSPSFLYLIDKGLRSLENPSFGSWGGRFAHRVDNEFNPEADYWCTAPDVCEPPMTPEAWQITRWSVDWMCDFAERATWCVTSRYEDANHAPTVAVLEGLDVKAMAGERVTLHAEGSDPDGDELAYEWFRYADADSFAGEVRLETDESACVLTVPFEAQPGDTIHLVCRIHDVRPGCDTHMVSYARVIVTVSGRA